MIPNYKIISSGSKGNAVIIEDQILIDCGIPFLGLERYYKDLKLVLLTHEHSDHFKKSTIRKLAELRPTLRFACGGWLAEKIIECGIKPSNIDIFKPDEIGIYGGLRVSLFMLHHDVPNCGWKIHINNSNIIYATDTNSMNGIKAKNFDLYLIEANHLEKEIAKKIEEKQAAGEFAYEIRASRTHLSKEKCDAWLADNLGEESEFVYMHGNEEMFNG